MPVSVIADSAAALDPELCAEMGVFIVPMQLEIAGQPVSESDVTLDEIVAHLDDGVQTSGPSPGAFVEVLEEVGAEDGAIILTVSERFSSTFQAATTGVRLSPEHSSVRVVDTGTAAGAEGLVVLAAARAARAGASLDEVEKRARLAAERVRLVAAIDDLTYVIRGGRMPQGIARAGAHLGVRLLFELQGGHIHPMRPSLSADGASDHILGQLLRSRVEDADLHVAALHALRPEEAESLLSKVRAEVKPASSFVGTFGPVMVAHTGPGVIGLAWWWDDPATGS